MKTLTEKVYRIAPPGGIFDATVVSNLFADRSRGARRLLLDRAVRAGEVLRLKRGLYVLAPEFRKSDPHPFAVAAMLYSPSHVSLESALGYWDLIPETVYQVASVGVMRNRDFETPLGFFSFRRVPTRNPKAGVNALQVDDNSWAFVATPLRALADMVYLDNSISWGRNGKTYLLESLRIEAVDLEAIAYDRCEEIANAFVSRRVKGFLHGMKGEFAQ